MCEYCKKYYEKNIFYDIIMKNEKVVIILLKGKYEIGLCSYFKQWRFTKSIITM